MNDDPIYSTGHSFEAALLWVQALVLGQIGTAVAILAIAIIGFGLLQGQVSTRNGMRALLGCFILFGAPSIAMGLMNSPSHAPMPLDLPSPPPQTPTTKFTPSRANANPFAPYAD